MAGSVRWLLLTLLAAPAASAEPRRIAIETPVETFTTVDAEVAPVLFVNRCSGGCDILGTTTNDASSHATTIPAAGSYRVNEFTNSAGDAGAAADADWQAVIKCLQEVYSPYAITVTDVKPTACTLYNEAIVAGRPQEIGLAPDILGISPLATDCSPQANVMSFSFANYHGVDQRVNNICWTAAQESAHAYGLDHEYEFTGGESACSDPMTY